MLPCVNAAVMQLFLDHFADTLADDVHAAMVVDGAGWHNPRALDVPDNVTLILLPPHCPEFNPVERIWLYLRERFLSLRLFDSTEAIIEACCLAWNKLVAEPGRLKSLSDFPWISEVSS